MNLEFGVQRFILGIQGDVPGGVPLAEVAVYAISEERLRETLELAAKGHPVNDLMLALQAMALASEPHEDDGSP